MLINNIGIQLYISKTWKIKKIRKSCGKKIELLSNPSLRTLLYPYHKNNKEMVLIEDDRWWKSTLEGRWPSMADTIRWKTNFDGRGPSKKDRIWCKMTRNCRLTCLPLRLTFDGTLDWIITTRNITVREGVKNTQRGGAKAKPLSPLKIVKRTSTPL